MRWLIVCSLLVACSETPRPKVVRAVVNPQPDSRAYQVRSGELIVIDVPIGGNARYSESQKCFVFRDTEFRTASMQCPNESVEVTPQHAEIETRP